VVRPYVAKVATPDVSAYSAIFSVRGLTLIAEQWDNGEFAVHAIRTTGSALFGTPQHDATLKGAVNALCGALGFPGSPAFP
jgi:hypothetical protein